MFWIFKCCFDVYNWLPGGKVKDSNCVCIISFQISKGCFSNCECVWRLDCFRQDSRFTLGLWKSQSALEGKDGTELAGRGFSLNNKYQTLEIQNSAAEQQFRANLCKSDFLRDISHFLEAAATPHVFVYPHFWAKQAISTKIQRQIQMPGNDYKFKHGYTELQSNTTLLWCHSFFHIELKQEKGIIQYQYTPKRTEIQWKCRNYGKSRDWGQLQLCGVSRILAAPRLNFPRRWFPVGHRWSGMTMMMIMIVFILLINDHDCCLYEDLDQVGQGGLLCWIKFILLVFFFSLYFWNITQHMLSTFASPVILD